MANATGAENARRQRRLRSTGFLKSLGVERTTAFFIGAVAGLLCAFVIILTSKAPPVADVSAELPESVSAFDAAKSIETSR